MLDSLLGRHRWSGRPPLRPGQRARTSQRRRPGGRGRWRLTAYPGPPPRRDRGPARVPRLGAVGDERLAAAGAKYRSTRLNDGRCDPAGRFWVGSMFDPAEAGQFAGSLYRVSPDGTARTVRTEVGVSNGLAFSPDGRTMYFADTPRATVWAFDYDPDTGDATNERVFLDFTLAARPAGWRLRRRGRVLLDRLRRSAGRCCG